MRCRLCGREASRIQEGEGHAVECRHCGPYWISPLLVREVLKSHADMLAKAVHALNDAGRPRVELRSAADIERVLVDAEMVETTSA